jgi:hypothetical protein
MINVRENVCIFVKFSKIFGYSDTDHVKILITSLVESHNDSRQP